MLGIEGQYVRCTLTSDPFRSWKRLGSSRRTSPFSRLKSIVCDNAHFLPLPKITAPSTHAGEIYCFSVKMRHKALPEFHLFSHSARLSAMTISRHERESNSSHLFRCLSVCFVYLDLRAPPSTLHAETLSIASKALPLPPSQLALRSVCQLHLWRKGLIHDLDLDGTP